VGAANSAAPPKRLTTSAKIAAQTSKASAGPPVANSATDRATQLTPLAFVPTHLQTPSTSAAAGDNARDLQARVLDLLARQQQEFLQLVGVAIQQPPAPSSTTEPPKRSKSRRRDQHRDQDE
jgi:hypothetical protein